MILYALYYAGHFCKWDGTAKTNRYQLIITLLVCVDCSEFSHLCGLSEMEHERNSNHINKVPAEVARDD